MKRQFFDLKPGDTVMIGDSRVTVEPKTGNRIRLRVESSAPTRRLKTDESAPLSLPRAVTAPGTPLSPLAAPAIG